MINTKTTADLKTCKLISAYEQSKCTGWCGGPTVTSLTILLHCHAVFMASISRSYTPASKKKVQGKWKAPVFLLRVQPRSCAWVSLPFTSCWPECSYMSSWAARRLESLSMTWRVMFPKWDCKFYYWRKKERWIWETIVRSAPGLVGLA